MYLHRNGLCIRKVEHTDLDFLKEIRSASWNFQHKTLVPNSIDQEKWFHSISSDQMHFIADDNNSIGVVSITSIDWINRSASVAGALHPSFRHQKKGKLIWEILVDFPFEVVNLHRIEGEVLEYHSKALHMDTELGFQVEGRRRSAIYKFGKYHDSILMGMLRSEWVESDRVKKHCPFFSTKKV